MLITRPVNYSTDTLILNDNITEKWSNLNRADYSNPEAPVPPSYSVYTGISLGTAFILFCLISLLQFLSILIGKYFTVDNLFKKLNLLDVLIHAGENINLAYPVEDWDKQKGNMAHFRQMSRKVWQEMFTTITINFCWAFIKLTPMFYTGKKFTFLSVLEVHTYNLPLQVMYLHIQNIFHEHGDCVTFFNL